MSERRFLSKVECAKALGISLPGLNRRLKDGTVPYVNIGSRVLIPTSYVQQLESQAMRNVTAPQPVAADSKAV